jgi:uncharacterized membrane protein YgcG
MGKACVILVFLLSLFVAAPAVAQDFTINTFRSNITIHPDSSFVVRETIEVTFHRPRHGIYRDIPFKYPDDLGRTITTPVNVLSVTDGAGKKWNYRITQACPQVTVRIGDANRFVDGRQTYVITYQVENAVLFFDDHDELYWNVTGNNWKATIQEATADVDIKVKNKSRKLWASGYTGSFGSRESDCTIETSDNRGKFFSTKALKPGEGLTIAFGWDKGLVAPPSSWKRFLWAANLGENWVFLLPLFSLLYMANRWHRRGRDPRVKEAVKVMYEPPAFENRPLTPAEVGTLVDEKLDPRDITSSIVSLAVKGYLSIEETKKEGLLFDRTDYYLRKLKEPDSNLGLFEMELMKSLLPLSLPGVHISELKNKFYTNLKTLKKTLYGELVRKRFFATNPDSVRNSYRIIGVLIMVFGGFAGAFLAPYAPGKGIFAFLLTGLSVLAFSRFMPAKTKAGAGATMDILGFQEFMNRAEKDRLERTGDKDLFSRFLPYAIALDVTDNWARAFEGIYQNSPQWYVSPMGHRAFSPYAFSHSLNSVTSSLSSAMFSAPRGSGMKGGGGGRGGFSGGGFGGGGGGSW